MALSELSADELRELAPQLDGAGLAELLREGAPLESKQSAGGTSLARVREQLERARALVGASRPS
jgi:argininosuccinate lyase